MSPKNVLAVFGATGTQGSSLIRYVLNDPVLSAEFSIRALTRNPSSVSSEKAPFNVNAVEMVAADVTSPSSLSSALKGVHTAFVMTPPAFGPNVTDPAQTEFEWVKTVADVAVAEKVEWIIYSTLPNATVISGGKYTKVAPFDAKERAEAYIKTLTANKKIRAAFFCPGWFMHTYLPPIKKQGSEDTWVVRRCTSPQTKMPMIDAEKDTGTFVGAILANAEKFEGKTVFAAEGMYTIEEVVAVMAKTAGKKVEYQQVTDEELMGDLEKIGGVVSQLAAVYIEGFKFGEEFGLFGPGTEEKVSWAVENAVREGEILVSLEEYFREHPAVLQ
ncbi:NAD(P)-binding protein [Podospora australis]|uniref:NAD(P)-binding protein n=1 Tax=Podospora australis TaxID=1536484 RepID=A0AAN6WT01_9PEZI|nr:NAD(P)-binding protein [Podospora australis]